MIVRQGEPVDPKMRRTRCGKCRRIRKCYFTRVLDRVGWLCGRCLTAALPFGGPPR